MLPSSIVVRRVLIAAQLYLLLQDFQVGVSALILQRQRSFSPGCLLVAAMILEIASAVI